MRAEEEIDIMNDDDNSPGPGRGASAQQTTNAALEDEDNSGSEEDESEEVEDDDNADSGIASGEEEEEEEELSEVNEEDFRVSFKRLTSRQKAMRDRRTRGDAEEELLSLPMGTTPTCTLCATGYESSLPLGCTNYQRVKRRKP